MPVKTDDYSTFGQDSSSLLQMQLRSWRYYGYCFLQRLKKHQEIWSTFLWEPNLLTTGLRIKKNMKKEEKINGNT